MKLEMEKSGTLKNCIGAISNLVEEANFEFGEKAVVMKAMDPSHVALVDFRLSKEAFREYRVEEPRELAIDPAEMSKIMSRAKKSDRLSMSCEDDDNLAVTFTGNGVRTFTLPLLSLEAEAPANPDVEYTAWARVSAGVIGGGLKDASLMRDNVVIDISEERFLMRANSDTGRAETELDPGSEAVHELEVEEPSNGMYNIDYLQNMLRGANSRDFVELAHATDTPIEMTLSLADGKGHLRFMLAPRVESG